MIGFILTFRTTELFLNSLSKKKILVTGIKSQLIGDLINIIINKNEYELYVHIQPNEERLFNLNYIEGSIKDDKQINKIINSIIKLGSFDIIINNLHNPKLISGSILNINDTYNIKNNINFISNLLQNVNTYGKIINLITDLEEYNETKIIDYNINYFFKQQSLENYKNKIAFVTIKFAELSNNSNQTDQTDQIFNFILENKWDVLSGREFYADQIQNKSNGYYLELANININSLSDNFKEEPNIYTNHYSSLKNKLAKINQININNICFYSNTVTFIKNAIEKFVPVNHHIILYNLPDYNFIPINRSLTTDTFKIINKRITPDYPKILEKINSLTRLIFITGPVNQIQFNSFINQVPYNILIIIDMTWDNFIPKNIPDNNYRNKQTTRCYKKSVSNNFKMSSFIKSKHTIILIDTFTKIHDLPDISLAYTVCKPEINSIISTFGNIIGPFNENVIINKLEDPIIQINKQKYASELYKMIELLDRLKLDYHIVNPITIKINLEKTDSENFKKALSMITPSNSNYVEIIEKKKNNEIVIYIDNELANSQNIELIKNIKKN